MTEYTPTTEEVRDRFIDGFPIDTWVVARGSLGEDFDRWLAEHDRQVAERAWDEGSKAERDYQWRAEDADAAGQGVMIVRPVNPYRKEARNDWAHAGRR